MRLQRVRHVLVGAAMLACLGTPTLAEARKPGTGPEPIHDYHFHSWWDFYFPQTSHSAELGVYSGALLLSQQHELFSPDPERVDQGFARLWRVSPDIGLRVGYYPLRFLGLEAEGGVLGLHSKPEVLGRDVDAALHFGAGLEVSVNWRLVLRFDARDIVSWRRRIEPSFGAHSLELALGLAVTFP